MCVNTLRCRRLVWLVKPQGSFDPCYEEDSWNEIHVVDNNAYVRFMKKLKLLKERIKAWNSSYRELTICRKNTLKSELANLDSVLDRGEVDGNWVESPQLVKNEFYAHFKQRFEKPNLSGIQFDREFPNKICSEQAVDLEREVSKEEVKRAVWDCGIDKAPGPDGFTFGFYRRFWNLIECDVVKAVKWFFLHERIPSGGNSSFITLIPKASNANMWNQSNIDTIVRVLKVFHSASGLRINMKKSKLMWIAVDASRVEQAIRQIGCMALKMPFKYLGLVVGDRMSRVESWNDVIDTL
nr:RNA-directed DNA polymerase, eukaryota, reverse transcriptase zinc-binding domain protein [Tanacetum cinerariifolium]